MANDSGRSRKSSTAKRGGGEKKGVGRTETDGCDPAEKSADAVDGGGGRPGKTEKFRKNLGGGLLKKEGTSYMEGVGCSC